MKGKEFSYDKAMQELEDITKRIESGECKIDDLTSEVKKAWDLINMCKNKLQDVDDTLKASSDDKTE
jgi:exodeoxyribonuclease VII small subunit